MLESRYWLLLAAAGGFLWLLHLLAPVITPLAAAAALAYLGDPLVDRVEKIPLPRSKISRTLAVVLVFTVIFLVLSAVLLLVLPLLFEQLRRLVHHVPDWFAWLVDSALPWVQARLGLESLDMGAENLKAGLSSYWKPVAVIFAVLAGGQLFGFLGILLALPVAAALNVLVRQAHRHYRGSILLRDEAALDGDS